MNTKQRTFYPIYALAACLAVCGAFLLANLGAASDTHRGAIELLMQSGVIALLLGGAGVLYARQGKGAHDTLILLILTLGVLMRAGYMLYTPVAVRQHDLGAVSPASNGHAAYILRLAQGRLPDNNTYELYHPPLYHALSALTLRAYQALSGLASDERLIDAGKLVSCCASIVTLLYSLRLIRLLKLSDGAALPALCIAAFLPNHYLLAGRVNNDALAVLFMTAILYYTLRWYKKQTLAVTIKLALCFGLGMMTKISVGMLALATGPVMLWVCFLRARQKDAPLRLMGQLALFALIAFPLGLWYPLRNLLLFDQPLNYVLRPESPLLYTGDASLWQRFGLVFNRNAFNRPLEDYNLWQYVVRGAIFGEFTLDTVGDALPALLRFFNLALVIFSIAGLALALPSLRARGRILLLFYAVIVVSHVYFYLEYPYGCTMDYRYIVPTALLGALAIGRGVDALPAGRVSRAGRAAVFCAVAAFSALSITLYCNL